MTEHAPRAENRLKIYLNDDAWHTLDELAGSKSKSHIVNQLLLSTLCSRHLRNAGFKPVTSTTSFTIPLALESIPTGFPSPAADYIEDAIDLNKFLVSNPNATFLNRIRTLSMLNAGLDIGDVVVIDRSIQPKHRSIVVALIDNKDLTIKRLMISSHMTPDELAIYFGKDYDPATIPECWLKAENPEFDNIYPDDGQTLQICAVVTWNLKQMLNH